MMRLGTDVLQHKGYFSSIEVSSEDGCLFGRLLSIRALVSYEGRTLTELRKSFEEAVDDYLVTGGCSSNENRD